MTVSTEVASLDGVGQAALVRAGELTAAELVAAAIERIERLDGHLNAVVTRAFDQALSAAANVSTDAPFAGVPFLVKDLGLEVAGLEFSEGSRFLQGLVSHEDSELTVRLRRAGLVILGKTNTPEFGMAPTAAT